MLPFLSISSIIDVANLQVDTPDGYIDIESSDDKFLVNCGLYIEKITNGYYKVHQFRAYDIDCMVSYFYFAFLSFLVTITSCQIRQQGTSLDSIFFTSWL